MDDRQLERPSGRSRRPPPGTRRLLGVHSGQVQATRSGSRAQSRPATSPCISKGWGRPVFSSPMPSNSRPYGTIRAPRATSRPSQGASVWDALTTTGTHLPRPLIPWSWGRRPWSWTAGLVLLQRRSDSGNGALPGGTMDIGETLAQSAIREVKEETGFDVQIERIVAIYSDPGWHRPAFMIAVIFRRILPKSYRDHETVVAQGTGTYRPPVRSQHRWPMAATGATAVPRAARHAAAVKAVPPRGPPRQPGDTPHPPDPAGPGSPRTSGYRIRGSRQGLIALMGRSRWMELQVRQTAP